MFTYLILKNFKSFKDITLDMRGPKNKPKPLVFLYGENGSGKTNLIESFYFLSCSINTMFFNHIETNIIKDYRQKNLEIPAELSDKLAQIPTLQKLISSYKFMNSTEPLDIEIGFSIPQKDKNIDGYYHLVCDNMGVIEEELYCPLNIRKGFAFKLSATQKQLSSHIFKDHAYRQDLLKDIQRFWGKHSFLALLNTHYQNLNQTFINQALCPNLALIIQSISRQSIILPNCGMGNFPHPLLMNLTEGNTQDTKDKNLKLKIEFIQTTILPLYSDILDLYYRYEYNPAGGYNYKLYFKKNIYGEIVHIPYNMESQGTQRILNLLPIIGCSLLGETVCIDEIELHSHDLLIKQLIENIKEEITGQLICTTHNTALLEILNPNWIYIIDIKPDGYKAINAIADYQERVQRTHNLRLKYLRGDYGGIPYPSESSIGSVIQESITNYLEV